MQKRLTPPNLAERYPQGVRPKTLFKIPKTNLEVEVAKVESKGVENYMVYIREPGRDGKVVAYIHIDVLEKAVDYSVADVDL